MDNLYRRDRYSCKIVDQKKLWFLTKLSSYSNDEKMSLITRITCFAYMELNIKTEKR